MHRVPAIPFRNSYKKDKQNRLMAFISPFSGLRYNLELVPNLARVIAPPYDKISTAERAALWERDPYNVVRLILPPPSSVETDVATQSTAGESPGWYGQAAGWYRDWIRQGILRADPPRFYIYRQTFPYQGRTWTRTGLFGALRLEDNAGPHAHEYTFDGPKADRLRLLGATQANLSPIFLLADGEPAQWDDIFSRSGTLLLRFEDFEGQVHELYAFDSPPLVKAVQDFIQDRTLVIADGHHRYETALNYRRMMREATGRDPSREPWGSVLALIVPMASPGLLVLPTHRVIRDMPERWLERLQEKAASSCDVTPLADGRGAAIRELLGRPEHRRTIVAAGGETAWQITLKPEVSVPSLQATPAPLRDLNITILHQFLLGECLGLTPEFLQNRIRYLREEEEALALARREPGTAAFLLGGLSPRTVFDVSRQNVRMPQKSTDFYPKIPTGLVIRPAGGLEPAGTAD